MSLFRIRTRCNPATGQMDHVPPHDLEAHDVVVVGVSAPVRLWCDLHNRFEVVDHAHMTDRAHVVLRPLLNVAMAVVAATTTSCTAFDSQMAAFHDAFDQRLLSLTLAEYPTGVYREFLASLPAQCPLAESLARLAHAGVPQHIASKNPRERRLIRTRREGASDEEIIVDPNGVPQKAPPSQLPLKGWGVTLWCDDHLKWERVNNFFVASQCVDVLRPLALAAVASVSSTCDEYRVRSQYLKTTAFFADNGALPRPPIMTLLYRNWARAVSAALCPTADLTATALLSSPP